MTTTELSTETQHEIVYKGITAVAARCDGALEQDGVGFNGQDTVFGRRIAAIPFSEWSDDIKAEAARIALTYRTQILSYTGVDVTELPVVTGAADQGTNRAARQEARDHERRDAAKAGRLIDAAGGANDGTFIIQWAKRDPEFGTFLDTVRGLPGRQWNGSQWNVPPSVQAADAIESTFEGFQQTPAVAALIAAIRDEAAKAPAAAPSAPAAKAADIVLEGTDRVRISFAYDPAKVAAVRSLPGRQYDGSTKTNTADLHHDVIRFATKHGLTVADDVRTALEALGEAVAEEVEVASVRRVVSNLADPAELPDEFVQQVLAACPKARQV